MTKQQQKNLQLMQSLSVHGNAYHDSKLWQVVHDIAVDEDMPMEHRLEALAKMNELTGEDDPCTPEALEEYILATSDD